MSQSLITYASHPKFNATSSSISSAFDFELSSEVADIGLNSHLRSPLAYGSELSPDSSLLLEGMPPIGSFFGGVPTSSASCINFGG